MGKSLVSCFFETRCTTALLNENAAAYVSAKNDLSAADAVIGLLVCYLCSLHYSSCVLLKRKWRNVGRNRANVYILPSREHLGRTEPARRETINSELRVFTSFFFHLPLISFLLWAYPAKYCSCGCTGTSPTCEVADMPARLHENSTGRQRVVRRRTNDRLPRLILRRFDFVVVELNCGRTDLLLSSQGC